MITPDSTLRHELTVSRLVTGIVQSRLNPAYYDLSKAVKAALIDYEPDMSRAEFNALRAEVSALVEKGLDDLWVGVTLDMFELADYEAGHIADELAGKKPTKTAVESAVAEPLVLAGAVANVGTWKEFIAGSKQSIKSRMIDNTIRQGYEEGQSLQQMMKRLIGTKANGYQDGLINNMGRNEADALIRTGANHFANRAREVAAEANADLIEGQIFLATFDNRTTLTCRHFGTLNKIYKIDDPKKPKPPLHFRCRSVLSIVPIGFDPFDGTRAAVGGQDTESAAEGFAKKEDRLSARRDKADARRAAGESDVPTVPTKPTYHGQRDAGIFNPGQIDAKTTMNDWMKQQPDWFIESSLGKTRAKLFKEGGLSLDKFTDMNGRALTLKEMRALDEYDAAFRKAKL